MTLTSNVRLLVAATTFLAGSALANTSTGYVKVTALTNWNGTQNNPSEALQVLTDQATLTNPGACTAPGRYILEQTSEIAKSLLIAALTTQKPVNLVINGCSADGKTPKFVAVSLVDETLVQ